jgi:hypothetical protein
MEDKEPIFVDPNNELYLNQDASQLQDHLKFQINWDFVLSICLNEVSKKVERRLYMIALKFIINYRECLNIYGWMKKAEDI